MRDARWFVTMISDLPYDIRRPPDEAYVFVQLGDEWAVAGRVSLALVREGRPEASFTYGRSWKGRDEAFALDPVHLPLGEAEPAPQPGMYGCLLDAGPDRWGSALFDQRFDGWMEDLRKQHPSAHRRPATHLERLLLAGDDRVGALAFGLTPDEPVLRPAIVPIQSLADLENLMVRFDAGEPIEPTMALAAQGTSLGGARPKVTARDDDGRLWLAKFRRKRDSLDIVRIEHATMTLARAGQIDAAETMLVPLGEHDALLVKRFDREAGDRRVPFLSAMSLTGHRDTDIGGSYIDIADRMRLTGGTSEDLKELFRRMAFNVGCNNTDDHLKNHGFLHRRGQWRLSPAYDIVPNIEIFGVQAISVGRYGTTASLDNLLTQAGRFGLDDANARQIAAEVGGALSGWKAHFRNHGVSQKDIDRLEPCFAQARTLTQARATSVPAAAMSVAEDSQ